MSIKQVRPTALTAGFSKIGLMILLMLLAASHVAMAQGITVGLDSTHLRSLPADGVYGTNAQQRGTQDWSSPAFHNSLTTLNQGILRIPTGTGSNIWDWKSGTFLLTYPSQYTSANNAFPSPLSEYSAELSYSNATPIFTINVLTDPTCTTGCTFSPSSPNLSYQMQLLATAPLAPPTGLGASLTYVELGNELYLSGPPPFNSGSYSAVYPTAVSYGQAMTNWIQSIKASYPNVKLAAVAAHNTSTGTDRKATWNQGLFDPSQNGGVAALGGEDAVTLHIYQSTNLPSGSTLDRTTAETMLAGPFLGLQAMQRFDFQPNGWIPTNIPVWLTEYNMNDKFTGNNTVWDTWGHGLFLATMNLLFLQNNQIQKLAHHATVGDGTFADIFADTNGLSGVAFNGPTPATVQWAFSAGGLTSMYINAAARGQNTAEELTFNGAPSITAPDTWGTGGNITYPSIHGWVFSGGANNQAVILNLYNQQQTINLSGLTTSGSYVQISGDPGAYITDGGNLQGVDLNGATDNLTQTTGTLSGTSASSFVLPAFSFTRITYGGSGGAAQVAAPTFSPAPGTYTSTQSVTISTTSSGASIRYTTDGSTPTSTTGTLYTGPVSISTTTILKAIAYKSGMTDSTVTSGTYAISAATPDFTVSVSPSSQMGPAGSTVQFTVTVTAVNGFTGTVSLSATQTVLKGQLNLKNWPYSFSPMSVMLTSAMTSATSTLSQTIGAYSSSGNEISDTVTGTSGSLQHSAPAVTITTQ